VIDDARVANTRLRRTRPVAILSRPTESRTETNRKSRAAETRTERHPGALELAAPEDETALSLSTAKAHDNARVAHISCPASNRPPAQPRRRCRQDGRRRRPSQLFACDSDIHRARHVAEQTTRVTTLPRLSDAREKTSRAWEERASRRRHLRLPSARPARDARRHSRTHPSYKRPRRIAPPSVARSSSPAFWRQKGGHGKRMHTSRVGEERTGVLRLVSLRAKRPADNG